MFIGHRALAVLFGLVVSLAACGGSEGAEESGDPEAESGNETTAGGDSSTGGAEAPVIDPGAMPPPGEAHVEVDGQTFVFKQSEMLEGPFACEIRDDGVTINFQSDGHDLLLQGGRISEGPLVANTTVAPDTGGFNYASSSAGGGGGLAVEAPHVLYAGEFDAYTDDDPGNISAVGSGTIAVTCP